MKKTLIALAVLAVSGAAFAQSTATISGGINVGIMDTGAAGAKAGVAHLGNGANAINIGVAEDLGGGLRGGFDSQIRFNSSNGDENSSGAGNALFLTANTYLSGAFGTARIGSIVEANTCGM
ncbi:porin, partial [Limnohabitans sp.]|uniref:porin n=1 Tax=Limnohabitans sp. TaxID=1907725 RepID=UPI0033429ACB